MDHGYGSCRIRSHMDQGVDLPPWSMVFWLVPTWLCLNMAFCRNILRPWWGLQFNPRWPSTNHSWQMPPKQTYFGWIPSYIDSLFRHLESPRVTSRALDNRCSQSSHSDMDRIHDLLDTDLCETELQCRQLSSDIVTAWGHFSNLKIYIYAWII